MAKLGLDKMIRKVLILIGTIVIIPFVLLYVGIAKLLGLVKKVE